jgi:DNA transformation protein and related proteins
LRRKRAADASGSAGLNVSAGFKEFVAEQMSSFGPVTIRSMFGGAGVYRDGLMFALLDDEVIYLKVDDSNKPDFVAENLPPFTYGKDGKKMEMAYFRIPERCLDDTDEMAIWCRKAFDAALRVASKKKPKGKARN